MERHLLLAGVHYTHNLEKCAVRYLVSRGADFHAQQEKVLRCAAEQGHFETVKYLIEKGADIHAFEDHALRRAAEGGHIDVVVYLVRAGAKIHVMRNCAVRQAARNGHLDVVIFLHQAGADIFDSNCLYFAAGRGHLNVVKYLVHAGVRDVFSLSFAQRNNHTDVVRFLEAYIPRQTSSQPDWGVQGSNYPSY